MWCLNLSLRVGVSEQKSNRAVEPKKRRFQILQGYKEYKGKLRQREWRFGVIMACLEKVYTNSSARRKVNKEGRKKRDFIANTHESTHTHTHSNFTGT